MKFLNALMTIVCLLSFSGSIDLVHAVDGNPVLVPVAVDQIDASADVQTMLGSDNNTVIISNIGAESDLVNEAGLMAALSDVSQFFEPGDNITTRCNTVAPTTKLAGQIWIDSDGDIGGDGILCFAPSDGVEKCGQDVPSQDKILEDDSSWEITDGGTGQADCKIDGILKGRYTGTGLDVNGTVVCDGIEVDAIANPRVRALSSDCLGADKYAGCIEWDCVNGTDGAEDVDILLKSQEGGANTTQMQYDESETRWEIPSGKDLALLGGSIAGRIPVGSDITASGNLTTTDLHGKFYVVTAACTVELDKVTDVGFGASVMLFIRDAAETCIIEIDDADKINRHGTAQAAGNTIDSPGNAGDYICLISHTDVDGSGTDGWITLGYGEAVWTDGGAS